MDDNIKEIVGKHIKRGLAKMYEWSEPDDHIRATYVRSMRFLAKDIVKELSGNVQPEEAQHGKGIHSTQQG